MISAPRPLTALYFAAGSCGRKAKMAAPVSQLPMAQTTCSQKMKGRSDSGRCATGRSRATRPSAACSSISGACWISAMRCCRCMNASNSG